MSFATVTTNANDPSFIARLNGCIAQEQIARAETVDPWLRTAEFQWVVAGASDVEAAYASALAAGNEDPGGDETVITDAMILAHVQAGWAAP